jgi:hypothetical protein
MCCGKSKTTFGWGTASQPQGRQIAPRPALKAPIAPMQPSGSTMKYIGRTALTVVGPATGVRYRFEGPGALVPVDARDRASLLQVPGLRLV